jgi:hypothetical protein
MLNSNSQTPSAPTLADRHLPHVFMPRIPIPAQPVPSHVNHIPLATLPDRERTFHVDLDDDGVITSR